MTKKGSVHALVECALMIAVGTVLAQIKLFEMPYGGAVTLVSMLPFVLVSFRWGTKWGLLTGFVNALLQMLLGFSAPPAGTILAFFGVIMLDYVLAFTSLGLAGIFRKTTKSRVANIIIASIVVCALRFLCSFLSGVLLWDSYQSYYEWANGLSVWMYSFIYNGTYMLPEAVITAVAASLITIFAPKLVESQN